MDVRALALCSLLVGMPLAGADAQVGPPLVLYRFDSMVPLSSGSVDLADFDGDGDLDVVAIGRSGQEPFTRVYCHSIRLWTWQFGETVFVDTVSAFIGVRQDIPPLWQGSVKWGDYDGDGDQDVVLSGLDESGFPQTLLYNYDEQVFRPNEDAPLTDVYGGENAWADYDGDGDLDLLVTGSATTTPPYDTVTELYENRNGQFQKLVTNLPGVVFSGVAWSDMDGDGDLDLALSGDLGYGVPLTDVFRNLGGGRFERLNLDVPQLLHGSVDWGDIDGDGVEDLMVAGGVLDPRMMRGVTKIYRNAGGSFQEIDSGVRGITSGGARFADFNRDGRMDVVVSGVHEFTAPPQFIAYVNDGTGRMNPTSQPFGLVYADLAVGDFNSDGDVDAAGVGLGGDRQPHTLLYYNMLIPEKTDEYYILNPDQLPNLRRIQDTFGQFSGCIQRR